MKQETHMNTKDLSQPLKNKSTSAKKNIVPSQERRSHMSQKPSNPPSSGRPKQKIETRCLRADSSGRPAPSSSCAQASMGIFKCIKPTLPSQARRPRAARGHAAKRSDERPNGTGGCWKKRNTDLELIPSKIETS